MEEMIEKVKSALKHCVAGESGYEWCEYEGKDDCPSVQKNQEALTVITQMERQNEELREANERLLEQLKAARELGQNGVPPMPCNVGDPLWAVLEEDGMIRVTKTACKELLWDGEDWLISDDGCYWEVPDKEVLFLSIEAAVKKAEEMLRNGTE